MAKSFADIDTAAWPVVVIQYRHVNPTEDEAAGYFGALAAILNDRATPADPCALVFDTSGIPLARVFDLNTAFFATHDEFTKAYYERFKAVCSGFGIVVSQAILRGVVKAALSFAPPTHPCIDYKTVQDAVAGLRSKRV